jgi:hypothetical protein
MVVVFRQQSKRDHDVVYVVEDEGLLIGISMLLSQKCNGMVSPMPARIEMMRRMVSVVEAKPIALEEVSANIASVGGIDLRQCRSE